MYGRDGPPLFISQDFVSLACRPVVGHGGRCHHVPVAEVRRVHLAQPMQVCISDLASGTASGPWEESQATCSWPAGTTTGSGVHPLPSSLESCQFLCPLGDIYRGAVQAMHS